jgi:hypothetical protein
MRLLICFLIFGCSGLDEDTGEASPRGSAPSVELPVNGLALLTESQYRNSIRDLFGSGIALPARLERIQDIDGFQALGASVTAVSPVGAERFESAAFQVAEQVLEESMRAEWMPCIPSDELFSDASCAAEALEQIGARIWRRPLLSEEVETLTALSTEAADVLENFYEGLQFGLAGLLMSPNFLYRPEIGADGSLRETELASKLSFFLWNTIPDDELFDLAIKGELSEPTVLAEQVDRMMADPRLTEGLNAFFTDLFDLNLLDQMSKDPLVYKHMNSALPAAAREETLHVIADIVLDQDADYRTLFTTRRTWVDRRLAAIYDVQAPSMDGFGWVELPSEKGRRGLLGHASILSLYAHAVSSSVTLRGIFVRERILCHDIPPPPADVNTSIPEASESLPTMRERVARHLEDPNCASCHEITDLVGLGLENFDGIARWRTRENDVVIDASGELDGDTFQTAWGLSRALANHPDLGPCLSDNLYAYANHHKPEWAERDLLRWHSDGFRQSGNRVAFLMRDIALSPSFRAAPKLSEEEGDSGQ